MQAESEESDVDEGPAQEDAFDRIEARTEQRIDHWVDVFARRLHIASRFVAYFLFPLVTMLAGLVLLAILQWSTVGRYLAFIGAYFLPFGLTAGVPAGLLLGIHPAVIISTVLWVDIWGTLFLVWNLALLERVPWLGSRLLRLEHRIARTWKRSPKLRDLGLIGLAILVALPVTATGAVPGALLGRIAGFPWALTWLAVFLGSAVRILAYTAIAYGVVSAAG